MKQLILQRVPPGDRWTKVGSDDDQIYISLTDGLNAIFILFFGQLGKHGNLFLPFSLGL